MKEYLKKNRLVVGMYLKLRKIPAYIKYLIEYKKFKNNLLISRGFSMRWQDRAPSLGDNTSTISFDTQYIYHPAWASRILAETKPIIHTDISSTINFCSIVSAFQPMEFYDYRPANLILSNLKTGQADLCNLPFENNSIISLSCMHTLEHIGLGRYGDPIDTNGDIKASKELVRVLKNGGDLLIAVPMGRARIAFNSHRVYSYDQIISLFKDLRLKQFSMIPDNALEKGMIINATKKDADNQDYGCGCFWFKK